MYDSLPANYLIPYKRITSNDTCDHFYFPFFFNSNIPLIEIVPNISVCLWKHRSLLVKV